MRNKKSDERVYLTQAEYEYMTSILLYARNHMQQYESSNGNRRLTIAPNKSNGGVNIYQTIIKVDPDGHFVKEVKRFVRLTRSEIDKILEFYGKLELFVDGYYDEDTYFGEET